MKTAVSILSLKLNTHILLLQEKLVRHPTVLHYTNSAFTIPYLFVGYLPVEANPGLKRKVHFSLAGTE